MIAPDERNRLRLLARMEQLSAALASADPAAESEARTILARICLDGSVLILADVFRGIVLAWDEARRDELERLAR
jgi:hypothetical protein